MARHTDPVEKAKAKLHIARAEKFHDQRMDSLKRSHAVKMARLKGQAEGYSMMTSNPGQRKPKPFPTSRAMSQEQAAQPAFKGKNLDMMRMTTVKGQYDAPLKFKGLNTVTTKKFQKPDPSNMTKALTTAGGAVDLYKHQKQVGYIKSTKDLELGEQNPIAAAMRRGLARVSPAYKMAKKELKDKVKSDPKTPKISHAANVAKKYSGVNARTLHSISEQGKGLYYNINKKRKEGRAMRKKGAPGAPKPSDFDRAKQTAKEETMKSFSDLRNENNFGTKNKTDFYAMLGKKPLAGKVKPVKDPKSVKEDDQEKMKTIDKNMKMLKKMKPLRSLIGPEGPGMKRVKAKMDAIPSTDKAGRVSRSRIQKKFGSNVMNEISKYKLAQYQIKAAPDLATRSMDQGSGVEGMRTAANRKKIINRVVGIGRAANKLTQKTNEASHPSKSDLKMIDKMYDDKGKQTKLGNEVMRRAIANVNRRAQDKINQRTAKAKADSKPKPYNFRSEEIKEDVDEGVLGALGGGIVGGMVGGPAGAALGAYAGHKMQQQRNKIKKLQKPKNEEDIKDDQMDLQREDAALKKVAAELEGASKKHLKQAQKVKAHVDKMEESNETIEQTYARKVARQVLDALDEGKLKDMVTGHMDKGKTYDQAVKAAQKDLDKMKPKQPSQQMKLPMKSEEALDELSRETLGRYMTKASDMSMAAKKKRADQAKADPRRSATKREDQRYSGVAKASKRIDKMEKEGMKEDNHEYGGVPIQKIPENPKHTAKMRKGAKMYKSVPAAQRGTGSGGKRGGDSGFKPTKMNEELLVEDGHEDVASARRKAVLIMEDATQLLMKLRSMDANESLPSWWMNKMAVTSAYMDSMRNYLLVPSQMPSEMPEETRISDEEAKQLSEGPIGATLGAVGGAALTGGPVGAGVGAIAGHKLEKGIRSVGKRLKQGYQAFKQKPKMEAADHKSMAKTIAKKAVANAVKDLTNEAGVMIITPMMRKKKVQMDNVPAGGIPTQSATAESIIRKYK